MDDTKPYFLKFLIAGIICLALSIYLLKTAHKEKTSYQKVTGAVSFISPKHPGQPHRDISKYRYLKITQFEKPFEVFVGKDAANFNPSLDKTDSIKSGDILTVYYAPQEAKSDAGPAKHFAYYIDKGSRPLFIFSPAQVKISWYLLWFSVFIIAIVVAGKLNGKLV